MEGLAMDEKIKLFKAALRMQDVGVKSDETAEIILRTIEKLYVLEDAFSLKDAAMILAKVEERNSINQNKK